MISLDSKEKKILAVVFAVVGLLVGAFLGTLIFFLRSPQGMDQLGKILMTSVRAGATAILTTTFTYFFIQRYMRKREAEANLFVARHMADLRYFLRNFENTYSTEDIEKNPKDPVSVGAKMILGFESKLEGTGRILEMPADEFLFRLRALPAAYNSALEKFAEMREILASIRQITPSCSPKFAATLPDILKEIDDKIFRIKQEISRTVRAHQELQSVEDLDMLERLEQSELRDIILRMYYGNDMLFRGHKEELEGLADERFTKVTSLWSAKEKAEYDDITKEYDDELKEE